jgi:hypothetical protein
VRHSAGELSDGAGLLLVRRLWDRLGLGVRIDQQSAWLPGVFRPSLMVEMWIALLLYGGGRMDDLRLLAGRGVRCLFGWKAVPDPTTFGRFLRRGGERLARQLDEVLWQVVRARWIQEGIPGVVMLVLDSTVIQRYGLQQAGAEKGYNPTKRGRPSHHPLVAFLAETRRLPGGALAARERAYGRWRDCLDPDAGGAAPLGRRAGDHAAAGQGLLLP